PELPAHFDVLEFEVDGVYTEPFCSYCIAQFAEHAVGPEFRLAGAEYDRSIDPLAIDPRQNGEHHDRAKSPYNMPPQFFKVFQEGHLLAFINFAVKFLIRSHMSFAVAVQYSPEMFFVYSGAKLKNSK